MSKTKSNEPSTMPVLIVTGASRGIGAEICRRAASQKWKVCVNYSQSTNEAEQLISQIRNKDGKAIAIRADVTNEHEVTKMFDRVDEELGPISALINNAGINGCGTRIDDLSFDIVKRMFAVNVIGTFICTKHAIRRMAKCHGGSGGVIVNISSAASKHGGPFTYTDYAASKGAIDTFTVGLAKEQASEGIRANCLRPGATMTELSTEWAKRNPEWLDWVMQQVPMGRPAQVDEIAKAAMFLISNQSSYVTGATLDVCGGWVSP
ncbi:MAG: NAD(P)-dependent oxidoreductase [Rhodospirillaceae bacterium]|nr:NAD(P)-dependent oxidoreductase [Rhodospirillaceae bacterium]